VTGDKTPKPLAQRVRESEARKRRAGIVPVKVWVPDTPEYRRRAHEFAASLCAEAAELKQNSPDGGE